jgi:hypothetical protein
LDNLSEYHAQGWRKMQNEDVEWGEGSIKLSLNKDKGIKSPKLPDTDLSECKIVMLRLKNQFVCNHASLFFSKMDDQIGIRQKISASG